jgi:hypothetical protein
MSDLYGFSRKAIVLFESKIGRCMRCMRLSFQLTLVAAVISGFLAILGAPTQLSAISWSVVGVLCLLWVTHLTAYALRAVAAKRRREELHESQQRQLLDHGLKLIDSMPRPSRRDLLITFARVAAIAAAATSVGLPRKSVADQQCPDCDSGGSCPKCCECLYTNAVGACGQYQDIDTYRACILKAKQDLNTCDCTCGPC